MGMEASSSVVDLSATMLKNVEKNLKGRSFKHPIRLIHSDILAFAQDGRGGNVTLNTPAFFGENYQPASPGTDPATLDLNDRVDINASGAVSGIITLPDVSFIQNSLTELEQEMRL